MSLQVQLVSERRLARNQRRNYRAVQGRLFALWDEYVQGQRTVIQLLGACSHLLDPK